MSLTDQRLQVLKSSNSNEWYTPEQCVTAVRNVLETIELDAASCKKANEVVKANSYYTIEDGDKTWLPKEEGGLAWRGKVFCNPPYGKLAGKFAAKAIQEYNAGRATEIILCLSGYAFETKWFRPLFNYPRCWVYGRLKFRTPGGSSNSSTTGTVFVYLGPNEDRFAEVFSGFGHVDGIEKW